MTALDDAFAEFVAKCQQRGLIYLHLDAQGYWHPPLDDVCTECADAYWTSHSGSHLRSVKHIALKHGVSLRDLNALAIKYFLPQSFVASADADAPESDVPSVAVAWKNLNLTIDDQGERILSSYDSSFFWQPHDVTRAYCDKQRGGACMGETCSCGLYFYWRVADAVDNTSARAVIVHAQIGGTVVECTDGCRAEYAVITGVLNNYPNRHFVKIVSELYEVPVIDLDGETLWTP